MRSAPARLARLLFADALDARVLQGGFALLVGVDLASRLLAGEVYDVRSWPTLGLLVVAVATLIVLVPPAGRVSPRMLVVVPLLDIAALGLLRLSPDGAAVSVLVVLPAVWLGRQHGRRGALLALVATFVLQSLTGLAYLGADAVGVSRAFLLPVVAGLAALTVAVGLEALRARTAEAEERGVMLEAALAELRRQLRRNETVLDTADVGMVLLDADGAYRAVNRRQRDFLELAFPDGHHGVAGQHGAVFGPDRATPLAREEMPTWRAKQGEEFDDLRVWIGSAPHAQRALSISARSVRDTSGELEGAVLAYHDVTDQVRAIQVKDDFVATVSHELRTPLTSIIGYLDLLQERDDLDDRARAHLDAVARNATRLLRLVSDLLHPAAGPGALELRRLPEELGALVREAVRVVGPAAHVAGVRVTVDAPAPVPVLVDRDRTLELLGQLLSNAVKYNRPGGRVLVSVAMVAEVAEVAVRDTGVGIDAAERDEVFTRFFRGAHAHQQAVQGVGLGLTIVKAVADAHGGTVSVDSEPGRGTTVCVRLPVPYGLTRRAAPAPVPPEPREASEPPEASEERRERPAMP